MKESDRIRSAAHARENAGSMWFYAEVSVAEEDWNGPHDSKEQAIAEARTAYTGVRDDFYVDEALPIDWDRVFTAFADAERIVDDLSDYIGDNEHVEDPEPGFKTSKAEAQEALERWFITHVEMRRYYRCVGKPTKHLVSDPVPPVDETPAEDCADCMVMDGCKRAHQLQAECDAALTRITQLESESDAKDFDLVKANADYEELLAKFRALESERERDRWAEASPEAQR